MFAARVRSLAPPAVALLLSTFVLLTLLPARSARAAAADPTEQAFRSLMNSERAELNRKRLRMRGKLVDVARAQSQDMADAGGIYHNPDLAGDLGRVSWSVAGENVGVGDTVESLHQAFMNSESHRRNILRRRFRKVGVGVVTADGRIWVTVVFAG